MRRWQTRWTWGSSPASGRANELALGSAALALAQEAATEPRPVTVTGPGVLDVTLWRQKGSITVHLVNLTNSMMMKGPLRDFIPTPPQKVTIRLPGKAKKVQLLVSGEAPRAQEANGVPTLTIPSILDHEVAAVDL